MPRKETRNIIEHLAVTVTFRDTEEKWGMEIKSPLSKAGMTVEEACKNKTFFLEKLSDGTVRLKRNHDYYLQIQGQLYCSNLDLKGIILTFFFLEMRSHYFWRTFSQTTLGRVTFCPRLIFSTEGLFSLSFLPKEYSGKLLYLHGGWLPYGQYSCTRTGFKLRFERQM